MAVIKRAGALAGQEVRQSFIDFFAERGHAVVKSSSLVPKDDPSLLFTNAGMVQFKQIFLGSQAPSSRRAVNSQKCLRISGKHNDLEQVGRDTYHHTFFEMLGNWSFGDYYKREAIAWAWELLTEVWKLPKERLWATVHVSDDEAEEEWIKATDMPAHRILRFDEDNFWEMGDTGPCGPCSEIHLDRGPEACPDRARPGHRCAVNSGCSRFIELWNLVFIQYDRRPDGSLVELPDKHVDTGMGLERITAVIQGVLSNYDCDLLRNLIGVAEKIVGTRYGGGGDKDVSFRVIADHARAIAFMIADGVAPSNEGRGYVLRRLVRRAARHGKLLGLDRPFLSEVCRRVVVDFSDAYPELGENSRFIEEVATAEEERFAQTLDKGLAILADEVERLKGSGGTELAGAVAFRLYDTYGFPLDLTEDIVRSHGLSVDVKGFEEEMERQRERARDAKRFVSPATDVGGALACRFVGDRHYEWESRVVGIYCRGEERLGAVVEGEEVDIVTAETPFYGESGGQVGDTGTIETSAGCLVEVSDTQKPRPGLILHRGRVLRGALETGELVKLRVDRGRREAVRFNHSATHILHSVLRERLGSQVRQCGSLVAPDRLRFDFSYLRPVEPAELAAMEDEINARIRANVEVTTEEVAYDEAIKRGALAFFGEKYGDLVRVVKMGEFSLELCGGTHVERTGEIGLFKFRSEAGVAAGIRRVEALTGEGALQFVRRREELLRAVAEGLKGAEEELPEKLAKVMAYQRELERRIAELQSRQAGAKSGDLMDKVRMVGGVKVLAARVADADMQVLREMADNLKERIGSGVIALGSEQRQKVSVVAAVTRDLTERFSADEIVKTMASLVGGGGGGRRDFAQAGGRDCAKLDQALAKVYEIVGG